jgi:enoyl-CoA hydratase/carnithine racemase
MGIAVERRGDGVAVISWDRPAKKNALSQEMVAELEDALASLEGDGSFRAVILTGVGGVFSAGADLDDVRRVKPGTAYAFSRRMQSVTEQVARLRPVTIAAVEGLALGAGMELALAADLRVASRTARLGVPEVRYGLLPAAGGAVRLRAQLGRALALYFLLTGEAVLASDLPRGFFARLTEPGEALAEAADLAQHLAAHPPGAIEAIKRLLAEADEAPHGVMLEREALTFRELMQDPAATARIRAFLARRPD